jgi:hypothetical protein
MRDPLRLDLSAPRSLRGILGAAVRLYGRYPLLFLVLAFTVVGPWDLVALAITGHGPLYDGHETATAIALRLLVPLALVTPLISALHLHAVELAGCGERPTLAVVAARGLRVLPVVAAASVVAGLGITAGLAALVLPGIYLAIRWVVVAQVAAAQPGDWTQALSRSWDLTRLRSGHVFAVLLIAGLVNEAVHLAVRAADVGSGSPGAIAVGVAADTVTASFAALITALLYFDLAARPERAERAAREHPHLRDLD